MKFTKNVDAKTRVTIQKLSTFPVQLTFALLVVFALITSPSEMKTENAFLGIIVQEVSFFKLWIS